MFQLTADAVAVAVVIFPTHSPNRARCRQLILVFEWRAQCSPEILRRSENKAGLVGLLDCIG